MPKRFSCLNIRLSARAGLCAALAVLLLSICFSGFAQEADDSALPLRVELPGGSSSDTDPAAGYIQKVLYPARQGPRKAPRSVGSRLTGPAGALYRALYAGVAEVARGDRDSTVFRMPVADIYEKLTYTAEELGISCFYKDGAYTEEGKNAINQLILPEVEAAINALLQDCPYELYWFDKTSYYWNRSYTATTSTATLTGSISVYFTVAAEYAVADKEFTFDTAWGQSVQRAAQNAQRIVNRSKGLSDINKLYTYKDAVCGLVSYNSAAAGGDVPYGNPWQLVWVFDGDTATNVVCEGYSKAFQYLCDLSDFSAAVTVISPYGYMASSSGGERHMWNVVTMGDGRNYLADLTNCDEGTVGYPNALFLTGALYGDTASGYVFSAGGKQYTYQYDSDVLSLFFENELQMSLSAYSVEASSLLTAEEKLAASDAEAQGPAEIQQRQDYPVTLALPAGLSADYLHNHDRVSAVFYAESDGYRQPVAAAETRLYDSSWWEIAFPDANTVRLTLDACRDFDAGSYKAVLSNSRQDGSETIFSRECYFTILPAEAPAARVLLQDGVKEIGSRAFADCHNLRQIYLPASVQSIAEDAFSGVSNLTLFGPAGSAAEAYALHHGLAFDAVQALPLP